MNKEFFLKQIEVVLKDYEIVKSHEQRDYLTGNEFEETLNVFSKAKAAIVRITGIHSEYYKDVEATLKKTYLSEENQLKFIIGIIKALKSDLQNDYLKSLNQIIQAEVFSDYLEMSEHLLAEGYKDPAAVLIGSTLEVHLRELCQENNIEIDLTNSKGNLIPKKADLMNSDLAKANIYSSAYQKQITAWLGIRNAAAHGKYSEYSNDEINLMLQGVRQFMLTIN